MPAMSDTHTPGQDHYLTPRELTALLPNVSYRTVVRWAEQGRIEAIRLPGGTYRIPTSAVEHLVTVDPGPTHDTADHTPILRRDGA